MSRLPCLVFCALFGLHDSIAPAADDSNPGRKAALLRDIAEQLRHSTAPFLGGGRVEAIEKRLASLPPQTPGEQLWELHFKLAGALLENGDIERSIAEYQSLCDQAHADRNGQDELLLTRKLALAWLRMGEKKNCVARHNEQSCLLPLQGKALHVDREGSSKSIEQSLKALAMSPDDLEATWLLNIANMTLGTWPKGVPAQWRIPESAFASEFELPHMLNVAPELRLDPEMTRAGGSILDDFDGDGRLDILVSSVDPLTPLKLFHQNEDGSFVDVAGKVGLSGQFGGLQIFQFDANGDGRLDILVQRGAWMGETGAIPNSLLIQQADGAFVDRTKESGIEIAAPSQVAAVADVDNDGDLDLFLGYESFAKRKEVAFPSRLLRNRGDGTFEDITAMAGVSNDRFCKGAAFGDYDGDGLADLYVSNMNGWNRLYRNLGGCKFADVALDLGIEAPFASFGCFFLDYNNDGWLDLYVTNYAQVDRTSEICGFYKNGASGRDTQRLYENDGHGGFRDVTRERGLSRAVFPMGCNFGDVDNDGFPDLYLATGDPDFASLWPNVMYRNDGGRRFQDVTTCTGTGNLQKGHGVSFGDLDNDGDQDLYVQVGGAFLDDKGADALFQNPGDGHHWLTVRLTGRKSNRFAIGTRIRVRIDEPGGTRDVYAFTGGNSSFGGNSLQDEIGLGDAKRIVELEVRWPATGTVQTFHDVPLDRVIAIEEGAAAPTLPPVVRCRQLGASD